MIAVKKKKQKKINIYIRVRLNSKFVREKSGSFFWQLNRKISKGCRSPPFINLFSKNQVDRRKK